MTLRKYIRYCALFLVLGSGFFYFSYKWLIPTEVNTDFISYYEMVRHPLNFHAALSPWVYRQDTTILANLFWRSHLYYPDAIRFHDPRYDQRIFFAVLLTNFLGVILTAAAATCTIDAWLGSTRRIDSILAGMLCFFSFYLQETTVTGQADGLSWALLAFCYYFYRRRRLSWLIPLLAISIFQREILPIILGIFALADYFRSDPRSPAQQRFFLSVLAVSSSAFLAYLTMRHFIHAPGNEYQDNLHAQWEALRHFAPTRAYLMQVVVGQNLLWLLLAAWMLLYRRYREYSSALLPLLLSIAVLLLLSIMTRIGNNAARMLALLTPIIAVELTFALLRLDMLRSSSSAHRLPRAALIPAFLPFPATTVNTPGTRTSPESMD